MEKIIKNILVPLNFSNSSDKALKIAIAMCKRHKASLHILKVNKENDFPYPTGKNALLIGIRLESRVAELKSLELYANQIADAHEIKCYYHIEEGSFSKTVAEVSQNFYCDLIVVEKKAVKKRFSLSFNRDVCRLIKDTSCPVMSVSGNYDHEDFKSILFPVWVKRAIISKLEFTIPIIRKNDSEILLFGSVKSSNDTWEFTILAELMCSIGTLFSFATKNIKNEVPDTSGTAKGILTKATELNSDLIVISADTNAAFPWLSGQNYSRFIINHATVPVLSVK